MWTTIARLAFAVLVAAVQKIPPEQWQTLGAIVVAWLQTIQDKLPAGHPMIAVVSAYKAPRSKLARFRPDDDE
ncbi:hypothetical protein [Paludisphaera borealis]|uniref:Uncharacterized protein n=1 Tax=Paludisphaera borealis TaxID=1387353 RepID=A0A1U7CNI1_9BACT|nr:hypothetical protein [Paludisphaera borealis]APW60469.1 hypothetical protein BSF38_01939 [Paludisphaera borealis]